MDEIDSILFSGVDTEKQDEISTIVKPQDSADSVLFSGVEELSVEQPQVSATPEIDEVDDLLFSGVVKTDTTQETQIEADPLSSRAAKMIPKLSKEDVAAVNEVAQEFNLTPNAFYNLIAYESAGGNPAARNPRSGARGLIQFLHSTARGMGFKNADEIVEKYPTFEGQLRNVVVPYLKSVEKYAGKIQTDGDLYLSVFNPASRADPDKLLSAKARQQNPGINTGRDYIKKLMESKDYSGTTTFGEGDFDTPSDFFTDIEVEDKGMPRKYGPTSRNVLQHAYNAAMAGSNQQGQSLGNTIDYIGSKLDNEAIQKFGKAVQTTFEKEFDRFDFGPTEDIQGNVADTPGLLLNPKWWVYNTLQMAPALAVSFAAGAGAGAAVNVAGRAIALTPTVISKLAMLGGSLGGGLVGGALEGSSTYQEMVDSGATPEEAEKAYELMTLSVGALSAISVSRFLTKLPKTGLSRVAARGINGSVEAITEWLEEPTEEFVKVAATGGDVTAPENVKRAWGRLREGANVLGPSFLLGFVGGGVGELRNTNPDFAKDYDNTVAKSQTDVSVTEQALQEQSGDVVLQTPETTQDVAQQGDDLYVDEQEAIESLRGQAADQQAEVEAPVVVETPETTQEAQITSEPTKTTPEQLSEPVAPLAEATEPSVTVSEPTVAEVVPPPVVEAPPAAVVVETEIEDNKDIKKDKEEIKKEEDKSIVVDIKKEKGKKEKSEIPAVEVATPVVETEAQAKPVEKASPVVEVEKSTPVRKEIPVTEKDNARGAFLAKKVDGIKYIGATPGVINGDKSVKAHFNFNLEDGTGVTVPVDADISQLKKSIKDKREEMSYPKEITDLRDLIDNWTTEKLKKFANILGIETGTQQKRHTVIDAIYESGVVTGEKAKKQYEIYKSTRSAIKKQASKPGKRGTISEDTARGKRIKEQKVGYAVYDPKVHGSKKSTEYVDAEGDTRIKKGVQTFEKDGVEYVYIPKSDEIFGKEEDAGSASQEIVEKASSDDALFATPSDNLVIPKNKDAYTNLSKEDKITINEINERVDGDVIYNPKEHDRFIKLGLLEKIETEDGVYVDIVPMEEKLAKRMPKDDEHSLPASYEEKKERSKKIGKIFYNLLSNFSPDSVKDLSVIVTKEIRGPKGTTILSGVGRDADAIIRKYPNGKTRIYVSPDLNGREQVRAVVHELFVHFGASKVIASTPGLSQLLEEIRNKDTARNERVREAYRDRLEKSEEPEQLLLDEWFADVVEEWSDKYVDSDGNLKIPKEKSVLQKVYEIIKDFIRSTFKLDYSKRDLMFLVSDIVRDFKDLKENTNTISKETEYLAKPKKVYSSEEIRLKNKLLDRVKLETGKTTKTIKNRLLKYAVNHMGDVNEKIQLVNTIDAIGTTDKDKDGSYIDKNYIKALKMIDDNAFRGDVDRSVRGFNKAVRNVTTKIPEELGKWVDTKKKFMQDVLDWKSLNFIKSFGKRAVLLNKDGSEKIGVRYKAFLDRKLLKIDTIIEKHREGGKLVGTPRAVFVLTDKGNEFVAAMGERFSKLTDNEGNSIALDHWINLQAIEASGKLLEFKTKQREIKKNKESNSIERALQIVNQIELQKKDKSVPSNMNVWLTKKLDNPVAKTILDGFKHIDMYLSRSLDYITHSLDGGNDDGFFRKHIMNRIVEGGKDAHRFKKAASVMFNDELQASGIDYEKMSEAFKDKKLERFDYTDAAGRTFSLTKAQRIAIYRIARTRGGLTHILSENGGIVMPSKHEKPYDITPEVLENILNDITPEEYQVSRMFDKYFKFTKQEINKVSLRDVGYELATEDNHHPILTLAHSNKLKDDPASLAGTTGFVKQMTFSNLKTKSNASNPIILEDAFQAMGRTHAMVANYVGMAVPTKDITRMLDNAELVIGNSKRKTSLDNYLKENGKGVELDIIRKYLSVVQHLDGMSVAHSKITNVLRMARNAKTVGVLGFSPQIALMQPSAYVVASTAHPYKTHAIESILNKKKRLARFKDFYQRSTVLWERYNEHIDREIGETKSNTDVRSILSKHDKLRTFKTMAKEDGVKGLLSSEAAMAMITRLDAFTISMITYDVAAGLESEGYTYGTPEFWEKAVPMLDHVVRRTQSTYSPEFRPLAMSNEILKPFTMFMTQPLINLQIVRMGIRDTIKGLSTGNMKLANKGLLDIGKVAILQPAIVALVRESFRGLRGKWKDDEEEVYEKFIQGFLMANIGIYPIIGSVLAELVRTKYKETGIENSHPAFGLVTDVERFIRLFYKYATGGDIKTRGDETPEKRVWDAAVRASTGFGLPTTGPNQMLEMLVNMQNVVTEGIE